tara:strand:- start:137 stop:1654 length:1518 start_codon:yes stop_codon:yes gene_type:complete
MNDAVRRLSGALAAAACAVILMVPVNAVDAQSLEGPLSVPDVIRRVLEADPAVINSRRAVDSARAQYDLTRAGVRPNLSVDVTPYSWDQRRVDTGITSQRIRTQSVGAGISVQQSLPTSGQISAGVSNQTSIIDSDGTTIEQAPEASVSLRQPLMVNGRLISTEVYNAGLRNAAIGVERSRVSDQLTVNGNIRQALGLYVQVASLRRSVDVLERTIDVLGRQRDSAEIDRQQGLISDNALLALQVTLNNRRETLFDTRLRLVEAEQNLARVLGLPSLQGVELADNLGTLAVPSIPDVAAAASDNPQVALQELAVEQTVQSGRLNDLQDRPSFQMNVRVAPVYPDSRDNPDSVASSFGDLFGDGADVEATVALGLTIPVLTARERSLRERVDELSRLQQEASLTDTERSVANQLQTLLTNRDFLERRVEILQTDVEYEQQRVENERALLAAGATTELRLDEVELDLFSRRNELWQVRAELYLNAVDIRAALGEDLADLQEEGARDG